MSLMKMKEWMTHFQDKVGKGAYLFYDFRNLLCDPTKAEFVQRGVDGRHQDTIQAIYGEPRFPEVMIQCTKEIIKKVSRSSPRYWQVQVWIPSYGHVLSHVGGDYE